jgi:hypothetical protein
LPVSKQTQDHYVYYDGTYQKEININANIQRDAMGYTRATKRGSNRPTLTSDDIGYMYFDTSNGGNKPIWYTGITTSPHTGWVDADGNDV